MVIYKTSIACFNEMYYSSTNSDVFGCGCGEA